MSPEERILELEIKVEALTRVIAMVGGSRSAITDKMFKRALQAATDDVREDIVNRHSHKGPMAAMAEKIRQHIRDRQPVSGPIETPSFFPKEGTL